MSTRSRLAGTLLSVALTASRPVASAASWTVAGAVNAAGLNGTKFVSDVTLTNPGTAPATVVVAFVPAGSSTPRTLSLPAGQTVVSRNVVDSFFAASGAGALSISSDQPLLVRARTYNTAASGTYGVSLPVFADDRLLTPGETGDSLWISQDASGSSGYRTNIALVFPDATGGAATVTVYDADGNERGRAGLLPGRPRPPAVLGRQLRRGRERRARAGRRDARARRRLRGRRRQRHRGQLAVFVRGPAGRHPGRPRERRRAGERPERGVFPNGRPLLQPDGHGRDDSGLVPREPGREPLAANRVLHPSRPERSATSWTSSIRSSACRSGRPARCGSGPTGRSRSSAARATSTPRASGPGPSASQQKPVPLLSFLTSADAGAASRASARTRRSGRTSASPRERTARATP